MDSYFLDSSVIIEYLRNNKKIVSFLNDFPYLLTSGFVVKSELYEGVFLSKKKESNEKELELFFQGLDKVYGVNNLVAKTFGKIRSNLRQKGILIEDMDILIGSVCIANNMPLITLNTKHFLRIDGLKVYSPDDFK